MTDQERDGLARLHRDLEEAGLPSPELLARYATEPNALTPEERAEVERAMAPSSPHARAVIDELDTLRGFDFAALDADRREAGAGWLARLWAGLGGRSGLWIAVAAVLALAFWLARPGALDPGGSPAAPQLAQQDAGDPGADGPRARPEAGAAEPVPGPADARGAEQLAMRPGPPAAPPVPAPPRTPAEPDPTPPPSDPAPSPRVLAEAPPEAAEAPPEAAAAPREMLLAMNLPDYRPAFGTDPLGQDGWVVRSADADEIGILVAGPDHVTRTSRVAPTLHWILSRQPTGGVFHLTILDEQDEPVVLDRVLPAPTRLGLQRLDLAALGVSLPEGPVLRWSVAWRASDDAPPASFDFGWLRVEPLEPDVAARLAGAPPGDRVALLAEAGCFHEALEQALQLAEAAPGSPDVERAIARLLEQAGLSDRAVEDARVR